MMLDDREFEALIARFRPIALRQAAAFWHGHAEDIVQEANLHAWQGRHRLDEAKMFPGWYSAILRNCAIDYLRKHSRHNHSGISLYEPSSQDVAREYETAEEAREAIGQMLDVLPSQYQRPLLRHVLYGETLQEAADRDGVNRRTLNAVLHHFRKGTRFAKPLSKGQKSTLN